MTSTLLCIVFAAAALICAAGWYAEHRRRMQIMRYWQICVDHQDEATRVIIQLTAALQAKGGRDCALPPRGRMYVN